MSRNLVDAHATLQRRTQSGIICYFGANRRAVNSLVGDGVVGGVVGVVGG